MKTYHQDIRDEFYRDHNFAVDLLEIHLGTGNNLYLATGGLDIDYDSDTAPDAGTNTYQAQGNFMNFSSIGEEFDVKVGKFTIFLSAIGNSYTSKFIGQDVEGKEIVLYKAYLNLQTLAIVQTPILMFKGNIHNVAITESPNTAQINLDCSSLFADFERTAGRKTNNFSNWYLQGFNTDTSMEKSGYVGNTEFKWGKV